MNTHHHLDQTLTRNLPQAQNINLFPRLKAMTADGCRRQDPPGGLPPAN